MSVQFSSMRKTIATPTKKNEAKQSSFSVFWNCYMYTLLLHTTMWIWNVYIFFFHVSLLLSQQCNANASKQTHPITKDIEGADSSHQTTDAKTEPQVKVVAESPAASSNAVAVLAAEVSTPTVTGPQSPRTATIATTAKNINISAPTVAVSAPATAPVKPARTAAPAASNSERKEPVARAADGSVRQRDIDASAAATSPIAEHQVKSPTIVLSAVDSPNSASTGLDAAGRTSNRYAVVIRWFSSILVCNKYLNSRSSLSSSL